MLGEVARVLAGERLAPVDLWGKLTQRFALMGVQGIVRMAMAGLDVALWDALAVAAGLPLATFLGGSPQPIPAYNSSGLGLMAPEAVADEAEKLLAGGFRAREAAARLSDPRGGPRRHRAVRRRMPARSTLMVDYNQALTVAEAIAAAARSRPRASPGSRSRSATTTTRATRPSCGS